MIEAATKYADVREAKTSRRPTGQVLVPKFKLNHNAEAILNRALREGGFYHEYLRREKALSEQRLREVARRKAGVRPNPKSELRLLAQVPAREFIRWKKVDKHFWMDDNNLRSLRRDNDTLRHLIHV